MSDRKELPYDVAQRECTKQPGCPSPFHFRECLGGPEVVHDDESYCAECHADGIGTQMLRDTVNHGPWMCPIHDRLEGELDVDDLAVLADPVSVEVFLNDPLAPKDQRGILGELDE